MIVYVLVKHNEFETLEILGVFKHTGAAQKAKRALENADRLLDRREEYTVMPWTVNELSPLPEENTKKEEDK